MRHLNPFVRDFLWFMWPIVVLWILAGAAGVLAGLVFANALWRG